MALLTPTAQTLRQCCTRESSQISHLGNRRLRANRAQPARASFRPATTRATVVETLQNDTFIDQLLERIRTSSAPEASPSAEVLRKLRQESREKAGTMRWPGRKDEAFRFTDVKALKELNLEFGYQQDPQGDPPSLDPSSLQLSRDALTLVTVDGVLHASLSSPLTTLPPGLVIGPLSTLPADIIADVSPFLGQISSNVDDVFSELNGAAADDVLVIFAAEGVSAPFPIHVIHATSASRVASPRLLVIAQQNAELEVVEEFVALSESKEASGKGGTRGGYWTNAVAEVAVSKGARVLHGVVQQEKRESFHIKTTAVTQEEGSEYSLIEAQLGGRLSRHNLKMKQMGPETTTNVSTISLCGARQLHDLHSSLVLDFPRGVTRQLHKCIVTESTGHGVFDGNVQVNRLAQNTDAGQLTRSLLLAPRGTVNVKPNLQIIADDVKCTHGAAISDLDDEQLFYFQARGIDETTARSALVFSFAAEVVEKFPYSQLRKRLESSLKEELLAQGAMDSHAVVELKGNEE